MVKKASKLAAAKKKAKAPKPTIKGKPTREERADLNREKRELSKPKAKAPSRAPARPVNVMDVPLNKLVAWLTEGMKKVRERLDYELPRMLKGERPASELAHLFGMVRDMSTVAGEALKPIGDANSLLSNKVIPEAFERENLTSFTTQDGYRVTVSNAYRASIKADQKAEAYGWLRDNNLGDLITETVHSGTLSAAGKQLLEEGKDLPEEIFNAAFIPTTSLTKVSKK